MSRNDSLKFFLGLVGVAALSAGLLWLAKRPCTDIVAVPVFDRALPCEITLTPANEQP